jgi:hypothetical protein
VTDQSPLLVPLVVEAFVVNDHVRLGGNSFLRTQMNYNVLSRCANGQPGLNDNDSHFYGAAAVPPHGVAPSSFYNGVYVKWRMPKAFTHGHQDSVAGNTVFPRVPNRWLVVRRGGDLSDRQAAGWIVESDFQWPQNPSPYTIAEAATVYLGTKPGTVPGTTTPVGIAIGRNFPLGSWEESGHSLGLTAVGPGNPSFAFYQPQNNNVFSFVDVLGDAPADTLSYLVLGWFSAATDDPLASATAESFATILADLGWTVPQGTDPATFATRSLLCGSITGVDWQTATQPPGGAPHGTPVSIAVGNTGVEALTALVTAQAAAKGMAIDSELLEAFQLDLLAELDMPDGAALLAEKLHASCFQRYSGGYAWEIVDAPGVDEPISATELAKELQWLAALRDAQAKLDEGLRTLVSLQVRLYVMWWKFMSWPWRYEGETSIPGLSDDEGLKAQLDPTDPNSLAGQVRSQQQTVAGLAAQVPSGDTPEALQAAIDAYAAKQGLPETRVLKRMNAPAFYAPNNPVVLIAGAGASGIVADPATALCRFPDQVVSGFTCEGQTITAAIPGLTIPKPDLAGVKGVPWSTALAQALVDEAFFVDPANATMVSRAVPGISVEALATAMADPAKAQGVYPADAVERWTANPWHPLQLLWQVSYYPIAYGTPGAPNWRFEYGRYAWNGAAASVEQVTSLQGLVQLTPAAAFNMEARIKAFLASNPHLDPEERAELQALLGFVQQADSWDLLSQSLNGFNEQLRLAMAGVFAGPATTSYVTDPPLTALLGDVEGHPPGLPNIPTDEIPPSPFQPWRSGQFTFSNLLVVDEWGQALWPVDQYTKTTETVYLPPALAPVLTSNSVNVTVAAGPAIASVSPTVVAAGSRDVTLAVEGIGFASDALVTWNSTPLTTTVTSATSATAVVPATLVAAAGQVAVTIGSGGRSSTPQPVLVASGPAIESLDPPLVQAGSVPTAELALTVTGVGFGADAVVQWDGEPLPTTVASTTELQASVPVRSTTMPRTVAITVVSAGVTSPPATLSIPAHGAIASVSPAAVAAGGPAFTLTVDGVGFVPDATVAWNGGPLATTFVDATRLTANVPASAVASPGSAAVTEVVGHKVLPDVPNTFVSLPPALLQAGRLDFDLISATDENVVFGPASPGADPVCGWVLPNHLDASVMAYDAAGRALGEMAVGIATSDQAEVCWTNAPYSSYSSLDEIAKAIPHFGPFLLHLKNQGPATFAAFMRSVDETLWTTLPMGAVFDGSLAILVGRPLAMVRARLALALDGDAYGDPSWQFTFTPETPAIEGYQFAIELGNVAQLDDGLIGYFVGENYDRFNVVDQAGAVPGSYLHPIGVDDNYVYLPPDGKTVAYVSMLVDPRAGVHATTAILPAKTVALPPQFVDAALAAMDVTFRLNGVLTDQTVSARSNGAPGPTSILVPVPRERTGTWSWVEWGDEGWASYPTAPNDAVARLSNVPPVLRRGLLSLSAALGPPAAQPNQPSNGKGSEHDPRL